MPQSVRGCYDKAVLGINHTTTGIVIALTIREPAVVLPLAFASHFILDMIPHHGNDVRFIRGQNAYNQKVVLDGLASLAVLLVALMLKPQQSAIIGLGVFFSILPDLLWPISLLKLKHHGLLWRFFKFHKGIQRSETPAGIKIEIFWLALSGSILVGLLG